MDRPQKSICQTLGLRCSPFSPFRRFRIPIATQRPALDAEIETLFWTAAVSEKLNRSSLASLAVLFQSKFRRRTVRQPLEPDDSGRHFASYCHPPASGFQMKRKISKYIFYFFKEKCLDLVDRCARICSRFSVVRARRRRRLGRRHRNIHETKGDAALMLFKWPFRQSEPAECICPCFLMNDFVN